MAQLTPRKNSGSSAVVDLLSIIHSSTISEYLFDLRHQSNQTENIRKRYVFPTESYVTFEKKCSQTVKQTADHLPKKNRESQLPDMFCRCSTSLPENELSGNTLAAGPAAELAAQLDLWPP